jgi:flagellar biosynthetic protein FliO
MNVAGTFIRVKTVCFLFVFGTLIVHGMLCAEEPTQATDKQSIGKFDINKVRELSIDPKSTMPETGGVNTEKVKKETTSIIFAVLRIIGSLGLIIAIVFGISWLIRKTGLARASRIGGGGTMDILEVLPLGQHRNVVLLRVMDTVYLCGQTPSTIALLDKIDGQRATDLLTSSKGPSTVVKFKDAFNQFVSRIKK